jgi:hypothetical protein
MMILFLSNELMEIFVKKTLLNKIYINNFLVYEIILIIFFTPISPLFIFLEKLIQIL